MRLNKRLAVLIEDFSKQPMASFTQAFEYSSDVKAAYRFFSNEKVSAQQIRHAHTASTLRRMSEEAVVLAAQDTSELEFTGRAAIKGLGPLDNPLHRGLKFHSCLAISVSGVPLGLLSQQVWARQEEKLPNHHKRVTKDKESQKWLDADQAVNAIAAKVPTLVEIADQEADVYDLFVQPRSENVHLLVRCTQDRRVDGGVSKVLTVLNGTALSGSMAVDVTRAKGREPRQARLSVRYAAMKVQPPFGRPKSEGLEPVALTYILAEETEAPAGVEPIRWLLATTLPVLEFSDALQCVRWYSYRWLIERFHYVLKSGCRIEQLQLEKRDRLERALAVYSIVAWRLLFLTHKARVDPDVPATTVLSTDECEALACYMNRTSIPPKQPLSLRQAVRSIARLGGFLGRTHDGEPGVTTLWRGMQRMNDITTAYLMFRPPQPHPNSEPGHTTYG